MSAPMIDLDALFLASGGHSSPEDGMCIMEATAYFAREPFSDHPKCVSRVIASFCRSWNDSLNDADRNRLLKPYVTKVIGTATNDADEQTRAWLATDWLVRVNAPAWLDLAGLKDDADLLRKLPPLTSSEIALAVQDSLNDARKNAAAAGAVAGDAAWDAARAAARDAARAAAWEALQPTVTQLQGSALQLFDAMITVGQLVPTEASR